MTGLGAFGYYLLEKRLAVGGTSEVFLANTGDESARKLIVKRPLPQFHADPGFLAMFSREAKIQAMIRHENVVRVFDAGVAPSGEPYLAMEHVEGVDADRFLRRSRQAGESIEVGLAVHILVELLQALEAVHDARDENGSPLGIVHRDVTPSNVYLSLDGVVKLGDFGLAHSQHRSALRSETGGLKGKFAYMSPEQVAGNHVDHRADLFSAAVILAELLIGAPLFEGGGQLAVLLAIRDGRVDRVEGLRGQVPPDLFATLRKALAKNPNDRHGSAADFCDDLRPFAMAGAPARSALAARVRWVQSRVTSQIEAQGARLGDTRKATEAALEATSLDRRSGVRTTRVSDQWKVAQGTHDEDVPAMRQQLDTGRYGEGPSFAYLATGETYGPWTFARLVEALSTGEVGPGDSVDYIGRGSKPVETIAELARFLPSPTQRTRDLDGGAREPDLRLALSPAHVLLTFARVALGNETGVMFAEHKALHTGRISRKEVYFVQGKVHHVVSSDASELLGEYLVRRGKLEREELDMALAVLPRYEGRMGDTLIGLGLVTPMEVFRAIREQGRDRCADLFRWNEGELTYHRGDTHPRVDFALDLEIVPLMLTGLEATRPDQSPTANFRSRLDHVVDCRRMTPRDEDIVAASTLVAKTAHLLGGPLRLREVLAHATSAGIGSTGDVLRALEVLRSLGIAEYRDATATAIGA
jgi:eukaryotic-like serine/threonine-protein kinase